MTSKQSGPELAGQQAVVTADRIGRVQEQVLSELEELGKRTPGVLDTPEAVVEWYTRVVYAAGKAAVLQELTGEVQAAE